MSWSDPSLVEYVQLVAWRRLPGIWPPDPSLRVGLIPVLLWSTLVVSLSAARFVPKPGTEAGVSAATCLTCEAPFRPRLLASAAGASDRYSLGYLVTRGPRVTLVAPTWCYCW